LHHQKHLRAHFADPKSCIIVQLLQPELYEANGVARGDNRAVCDGRG
jgi:hypothetical protein